MTWDERFADPAYASPPPMPFLVDLAQRLPPGRLLDLACGAGRHSALFASRSWQVTAVDSSPNGLALAAQAHPAIQVMQLDLTQDPLPPGPWDLTVITLYLDRQLLRRLTGTRVAIAIPLVDTRDGVKPMNPAYLLEPGELRRIFAEEGWEIEHYQETSPAPPARSIAELVARRS
ncbi:type 12 methyltransferase [Bryobacterales bacterium F-183]|nr:type 12 methyltransferase [Bryobacterales bacterium F-183]